MATQKQYNIKFNDDIDEEKEIINFLENTKNKNKLVKDAINLYMVLSESIGSTNPLKIMRGMSVIDNMSIISSEGIKADKKQIEQQMEEDKPLDIDMSILDSNLNGI